MLYLDVKKSFKTFVWSLSEKYIEGNPGDYVGGRINASERCGKAWESIFRNSILRELKKYDLNTNVNASKKARSSY